MTPTPHSTATPLTQELGRDLLAGFSVALIALPLCLGIAAASGAPPVMGLVSAILGGVVGFFTGSAPLSIKGPAAGLIVIVLGAVTELGYERALAVGVIAALLQLLFASLGFGQLAQRAPKSVIKGMMSSIGLIIIIKQLPLALGLPAPSSDLLKSFITLPSQLAEAHPIASLITLITLLTLSLSAHMGSFKRVPAPLLALLLVTPLTLIFQLDQPGRVSLLGAQVEVGPWLLVSLPDKLWGAFMWPDFSDITSLTSLSYIATLSLIGSIESLLSLLAVDQLDPQQRRSNLNQDLRSVGLINLLCASIGALPVISEIVRSRANISAGAQSAKANAAHSLWLLFFLIVCAHVIELIPLAALSAMLLKVGASLTDVKGALELRREGFSSVITFCATVLCTLTFDLLIGVSVGLALHMILSLTQRGTKKVSETF